MKSSHAHQLPQELSSPERQLTDPERLLAPQRLQLPPPALPLHPQLLLLPVLQQQCLVLEASAPLVPTTHLTLQAWSASVHAAADALQKAGG